MLRPDGPSWSLGEAAGLLSLPVVDGSELADSGARLSWPGKRAASAALPGSLSLSLNPSPSLPPALSLSLSLWLSLEGLSSLPRGAEGSLLNRGLLVLEGGEWWLGESLCALSSVRRGFSLMEETGPAVLGWQGLPSCTALHRWPHHKVSWVLCRLSDALWTLWEAHSR